MPEICLFKGKSTNIRVTPKAGFDDFFKFSWALSKGKSIRRSRPTSVLQVKLELVIYLGSLGLRAGILYKILHYLAILEPNRRPLRPENACSEENQLESLDLYL